MSLTYWKAMDLNCAWTRPDLQSLLSRAQQSVYIAFSTELSEILFFSEVTFSKRQKNERRVERHSMKCYYNTNVAIYPNTWSGTTSLTNSSPTCWKNYWGTWCTGRNPSMLWVTLSKYQALTLLLFEECFCKQGGDFWTDSYNLQSEMEETK